LGAAAHDSLLFLDVQPAIKARRRQLQEDVISHLISQGYNDTEILTECVTYAAAGMVTTREFISVAAWQLLEQPALRTRYLAAPLAIQETDVLLQRLLTLPGLRMEQAPLIRWNAISAGYELRRFVLRVD
jgi:cytochrome P450